MKAENSVQQVVIQSQGEDSENMEEQSEVVSDLIDTRVHGHSSDSNAEMQVKVSQSYYSQEYSIIYS